MLTVRSTVYFYKAENLILECCHPDNEVRKKDVGAWGLKCIGLHCTAPSTMEYVGSVFSYWTALQEGNAFYICSILTHHRKAFFFLFPWLLYESIPANNCGTAFGLDPQHRAPEQTEEMSAVRPCVGAANQEQVHEESLHLRNRFGNRGQFIQVKIYLTESNLGRIMILCCCW